MLAITTVRTRHGTLTRGLMQGPRKRSHGCLLRSFSRSTTTTRSTTHTEVKQCSTHGQRRLLTNLVMRAAQLPRVLKRASGILVQIASRQLLAVQLVL